MTMMKRTEHRLHHLDRMACNPNVSAETREAFRLAAWDLRKLLRRMAK